MHLLSYWLYVQVHDMPGEVQIGYTDHDKNKRKRVPGNDHIYCNGSEMHVSWMGALLEA